MTLSLERVGVRFGRRVALHPTTLELERGGLVGLVGPNGAGKSSLLKAAAGLLAHTGRVAWNGAPLDRMRPLDRARTIAYLPQAPAAHWPVRVVDLVALGRMPHRGFGERPRTADQAAVARALALCEAAPLAERPVHELSGGERSRVLLARALAVEAPVLLVDEPIQSLDPFHQLKVMSVLERLAREGALVVAVLHDVALAARHCMRILLLSEGRIAGDGTPEDVFTWSAFERHYRVEPYLATHAGEPVVVPWRRIDGGAGGAHAAGPGEAADASP